MKGKQANDDVVRVVWTAVIMMLTVCAGGCLEAHAEAGESIRTESDESTGPGTGALRHAGAAEPVRGSNELATVWFVVAEIDPFHNDSYVLQLSDPANIEHARQLIAEGPGSGLAHIVVAEIVAGSDGINRDVYAPGSPPWSWHVSRFETFAEVTVEICDGWPTFVESDVDGWIANTGGRVCFWTYTVVEELASPVYESAWGDVKRLYR